MGYSTKQALDDTAVEAQKQAILAHAQEAGLVKDATVADVHLSRFSQQGNSRMTYRVDIQDKSFILSVYTHPESKLPSRPKIGDTHAYQNMLFSNGVPVPQIIGKEFTLNVPEPFSCEMVEFIDGKCLGWEDTIPREALEGYAKTVATMHKLGTGFMPGNASKPYSVTSTNLPHGFVHADLQKSNLIFDKKTQQLKSVIDFEYARYDTLANDLVLLVMRSFSYFEFSHEGTPQEAISFHFDSEGANRFFKEYCKDRPIGKKEAEVIRDGIQKSIATYFKDWNQYRAEIGKVTLSDATVARDTEKSIQFVKEHFDPVAYCSRVLGA